MAHRQLPERSRCVAPRSSRLQPRAFSRGREKRVFAFCSPCAGISTYNGKQTQPGKDWMVSWFGKLPEAQVCLVMISPAYFQSRPCFDELYEACRERHLKRVLPIIFEKPPALNAKMLELFDDEDEAKEKLNFINMKLFNYLPVRQTHRTSLSLVSYHTVHGIRPRCICRNADVRCVVRWRRRSPGRGSSRTIGLAIVSIFSNCS